MLVDGLSYKCAIYNSLLPIRTKNQIQILSFFLTSEQNACRMLLVPFDRSIMIHHGFDLRLDNEI